jgi:hypothetical protein
MMFALVMIVVSLSSDVLALESHIRGQGMSDTNRDLKKKKCVTGTQAQILDFCSTNNCCSDGPSGCEALGSGIFTVCAGACNGNIACDSVGEGAVINSGACVGDTACYCLGQYAAKNAVTVAEGACLGTYACSGIGSSDVTKITIGARACRGEDACEDVGRAEATTISIAAGACTKSIAADADGICENCDRLDAGKLSIKGQQCPF